ncbi:MAG: NAD(P)/FAD-dependent oxidoreductase [Acidobacteriota bacterium]
MPSFDATIVGAGIAGLSLARDLSARGLRVLLIDRKADLTASVHTTGIFVRRTLEDFALPDRLLGPPIRNVVLYSPALRPLTLNSDHDEFRVGRMGLLYAELLSACVRNGVRFSPSSRFLNSEESGQGSNVRIEFRGKLQSHSTTILVGADGSRSQVASDLGLSENREWIVGAEEVLEGVSLEGPAAMHCFLDPVIAPGYIAWIVQDGEETHLGVGGYGERFHVLEALRKFRVRIAHLFDLSKATVRERRGGRIPVGGLLPRISNERGLLVGDAAGAVSPLTAGGFDGSLRLTRFAAEVIATAAAAKRGDVLTSYSGEHFRTRFISRRWMRRAISVFDSPLLLEGACTMLRVPPFSALARHIFFGRGSFPEPAAEVLRALADVRATS